MSPRRIVVALVQTLWIYTLAGWVYVAAVASFAPELLSHRVVGWLDVRRDTLGIACFAASACCYFVLQLAGAVPRTGRR